MNKSEYKRIEIGSRLFDKAKRVVVEVTDKHNNGDLSIKYAKGVYPKTLYLMKECDANRFELDKAGKQHKAR